MAHTPGKRGRSKAKVELSVEFAMCQIWLHVWENGHITHTFQPTEEFRAEFIKASQQYDAYQAHLLELEGKRIAARQQDSGKCT